MRKTNLFGATFLALTAGAAAWAQAPAPSAAPAPAPAPMATPAPAPEPAPMAAPAPAPEAAPAAPADTSATPPAATDAKPAKKHMTHRSMSHKGKLAPTKAGNAAVEDLNDASLNAAKTGKPFTPPATPDAAKKEAHIGDKDAAPTHHMKHHAMKKAAKPASDASATPPADTTAPAPADAPK